MMRPGAPAPAPSPPAPAPAPWSHFGSSTDSGPRRVSTNAALAARATPRAPRNVCAASCARAGPPQSCVAPARRGSSGRGSHLGVGEADPHGAVVVVRPEAARERRHCAREQRERPRRNLRAPARASAAGSRGGGARARGSVCVCV